MKLTLLAIIGIFISGLNSCCSNLDCQPPFDRFQFNYTSVSNEDLLGGTTKKYNAEDIKLYSVTIDNRKIFSDLTITEATTPNLSRAEVYLRTNFERTFLEVKGMVTDTIDFKFNESNSKCCGTVVTISEIKLNGVDYIREFPVLIVEKN